MRIAVLIKQVPRGESLALGPDGRLVRAGLELEMNAYCRRAVSQGVDLARRTGGTCTVFTLGPPSAEDALREAVAWGADEGVLITDAAFAGSDTLATASALGAALERFGPFDLILAGRNSVDADTGQVGPEVAELLGLPFLAGVKALVVKSETVVARLERDDGWADAEVDLPALLTTAERLCPPAKVDPPGRAAVDPGRLRQLSARDLGPGPWGAEASPTHVGSVRVVAATRRPQVLDGSLADQIDRAVSLLRDAGALGPPATGHRPDEEPVADGWRRGDRVVGVLVEPGRPGAARQLLGAAARLARTIGGRVVAVAGRDTLDPGDAGTWGADEVHLVAGAVAEEDLGAAAATWAGACRPWAVLAPSTLWGREVAARLAVRLGAGLTGDAVELAVDAGRLVAWKPAFGGHLVAAITSDSDAQLVTVRPGLLDTPAPRTARPVPVTEQTVTPRGRVRILASGRNDDLDELARAEVVVGVGAGVDPREYALVEPLLQVLGASLAATRKVTDEGWLPRSRQVGLTGRSLAPRLYVAIGLSGKFNHLIGVGGAGRILAINKDPDARAFEVADVGIVGDWHDVVPLLVRAIAQDGDTDDSW